MNENEVKHSDLDTLRDMIGLLQAGDIHFGNDSKWIELCQRPKAREAFAIAFQAIHREEVQPATVKFIFSAVEGMGFWMRSSKAQL